MASTPNATTNPAGSTQAPDGCVITNGAPVQRGGHWVPATCSHASDRPDHLDARGGTAGHQRRS
jgi:hypothetical protein